MRLSCEWWMTVSWSFKPVWLGIRRVSGFPCHVCIPPPASAVAAAAEQYVMHWSRRYWMRSITSLTRHYSLAFNGWMDGLSDVGLRQSWIFINNDTPSGSYSPPDLTGYILCRHLQCILYILVYLLCSLLHCSNAIGVRDHTGLVKCTPVFIWSWPCIDKLANNRIRI